MDLNRIVDYHKSRQRNMFAAFIKGAAIGAILGGGAGAGSVYVQGKEDLELPAGSSVTVQSTSPPTR